MGDVVYPLQFRCEHFARRKCSRNWRCFFQARRKCIQGWDYSKRISIKNWARAITDSLKAFVRDPKTVVDRKCSRKGRTPVHWCKLRQSRAYKYLHKTVGLGFEEWQLAIPLLK